MNSTNSTSQTALSARRQRVLGLWASALVVLHVSSVLAQSLGYASAGIEAKAFQCGPISDTIEYLIWLLQQL